MARRPKTGWEQPHNKRSLKGASVKELHRRRQRRRLSELMRAATRALRRP